MRNELEIFDAQRMIFADPTILKEVQAKIQEQHLNAAAAWHAGPFSLRSRPGKGGRSLPSGSSGGLPRSGTNCFGPSDRRENGDLALPEQAFADPTMLICEELTPTLAEQFRRLSIAGVIQLGGGTTSHGAILARALGLPAIGGARNKS